MSDCRFASRGFVRHLPRLFPLPVLPWRHPFQSRKELAERGPVGEMETVGDLGDGKLRGAQQERRFHHQHLVDVIDNGAPSDALYNP